MLPLPSILTDVDEGKIIFYLIFILIWVISAIASAIKKASQKSKLQPPRVIAPTPTISPAQIPLMAKTLTAKPAPALRKKVNPSAKKTAVRKPATAPAPPAVPMEALIPVPPATPAPTAKTPARPMPSKRAIADAYRRRLIWAEILGKPIAMREDSI